MISIPARAVLQIMKELSLLGHVAGIAGHENAVAMTALRKEYLTRRLAEQLTERELDEAIIANKLQESA